MRTVFRFMLGLPALLLAGCTLAPADEATAQATTDPVLSPVRFCFDLEAPCEDGATCQGRFGVSGKDVLYARNHPLATRNPSITRAVIVIHGIGRDMPGYFNAAVQAAHNAVTQKADSCAVQDTIILAPKFQTSDVVNGVAESPAPAANDLLWPSNDWPVGWESTNSDAAISSFAVVDALLQKLQNTNTFPNLSTIVIVGHSAGGMFTQRYAAGNRTDGTLRAGLSMRYVVANPSSYLYFLPVRPTPDGSQFIEPFSCDDYGVCTPSFAFGQGICKEYEEYRWGMKDLNPYMAATGTWQMMAQYKTRNVTYLAGSLDTDPNAADLERNCAAEYEGSNRYARAVNYYKFMNTYFPNVHHFAAVAGAGHHASEMIPSVEAVNAMFR